jgi:hypothetical protein
MPIGHLVCEGERGSLDIRLLDAILAQFHGLPILIEPGGGGNNPRVIRSWLERRTPGEVALVVHDRDYRPIAEVEPNWQDPAERCLYWRRHPARDRELSARPVGDPPNLHRLPKYDRGRVGGEFAPG